MPNINIGIATILDVRNHGGLEVYVRTLLDGIPSDECTVSLNGGNPALTPSIADVWQKRVNRWLPLMTRRVSRSAAKGLAIVCGRQWARSIASKSDIIHFVGTGWDLAGFPLANMARKFRKPITCLPAVHPGSWGDARLDIDLYKQMDAVFCLSDYEANQIIAKGVSADAIVRCGCSPSAKVEGNGERFLKRYGLTGKRIVLFIGRKSRGKGYHALRSAIGKLAENRKDLVLVSIGRDSEPPYPLLNSEIEIDLGAADEALKQDALAACDVFALPSEAESFGIVYVEAWSYGKPVICGSAPASRELVNRHCGGAISDGTPEGVALAITQVLENPERAYAMGQAGKQAAEEQYTNEKIVNRHLETWSSLRR